jgi:hypothetical protein
MKRESLSRATPATESGAPRDIVRVTRGTLDGTGAIAESGDDVDARDDGLARLQASSQPASTPDAAALPADVVLPEEG